MLKELIQLLFYEVDIFKVPFILLFKNRKKSSTFTGSLISICILSIVLYLFISSNMFLKINPFVIDQITTNDHAAQIQLTPENFQVAAGVANSFGLGFQDPSIFKIQFIQVDIDFDAELNSKKISRKEIKTTKNCTSESFSDPNTFNNLGLKNYACPINGSFILEGGFDERSVRAVVVMIAYCNNKTDGIICKRPDEITNFFKDKGLWLYYQDFIYDNSNYMSPVKENWRLQAVQSAAIPRLVDLYLKKLIFISDNGLVFSNETYDYGFMKERSEGSSDYVMVDSPLISINLFSSKNNQKSKRQYQKFGDLLANIGGVINFLMICGYFLTSLENRLQIHNHIMNRLYSFYYEKNKRIKNKLQMIFKRKPKIIDKNKITKEMNINSFISKESHSPEPIII